MTRPPIWPVRLIECDYGGPQQSRPEGFEDGTDTVVLSPAGVNQFGHTLYDIVEVIPESMSWSRALRRIHMVKIKHRPKNLMVVVGSAHADDACCECGDPECQRGSA